LHQPLEYLHLPTKVLFAQEVEFKLKQIGSQLPHELFVHKGFEVQFPNQPVLFQL
jgi:hypothetical protein